MVKKLKIIPAIIISSNYNASYYPLQNTIYYDKNLNKFPRLKKKILKHEIEHSIMPFNTLKHLYTDFIDYFKIGMSEDYYDYSVYIIKQRSNIEEYMGNKRWLYTINIVEYIISNLVIILILPMNIFINIYYKMKNVKRNKPN